MVLIKAALSVFVAALAEAKPCTLPKDTEGADDGNPHCWDRIRRCDGPNAHPDGGPGYTPACGACEGLGGIAWGDKPHQYTAPKCTELPAPSAQNPPVRPQWAMGNGGKFTVDNDRFTMIGKMADPFCFAFFPSNNSVGKQCYRRQTGRFVVSMQEGQKTVRYDLNLHIPWPSDRFSLFGNITTKIVHHNDSMWIVNNLYNLVKQCVCIHPLSSAGAGGHGSHDHDPIYPVMYNWTNHLTWLARERVEVEYEIGEMDLDHWIFGPHHAWTPVGSPQLIRMWQPYNGFEVFDPASYRDGYADQELFTGQMPPPECKKGGSLARIDCRDDGYPVPPKPGFAGESAEVEDLRRARTKVPGDTRKGSTFDSMAGRLNSYVRQYGNTKECAKWTSEELQRFQATLLLLRAPELDATYRDMRDARKLRGSAEEHGQRWEGLRSLAHQLGGAFKGMHRDGHCHEAVMWFVHHVPSSLRAEIAKRTEVPLLPYARHDCSGHMSRKAHQLCEEYLKQVSCQDCHMDYDIPVVGTIEFGKYPDYTGNLTVTGSVDLTVSTGVSFDMSWNIAGVEAVECKTVPRDVPNACGIHVHAGTTCANASKVGGHYFDSVKMATDPWAPIAYAAKQNGTTSGKTHIIIGKTLEDVQGRALVVHDSTGARVACGLIPGTLVQTGAFV